MKNASGTTSIATCFASFFLVAGLVSIPASEMSVLPGVSLPALLADQHAVHRYFPLHQGDWRFYSGRAVSLEISTSITEFNGQQVFGLVNSADQSVIAYTYSETELLMHGSSADGMDLIFDAPLIELDEDLILNGGKRTTKTSATVMGISVNLTVTVTIKPEGTVTVPAGTFQNCREMTETIHASIPGGDSQTVHQTFILAPGIGWIRISAVNDLSEWISLTSGIVDGENVSDLAAQSALSSPRIISQPKSQRVLYGAGATLQVTTEGAGPISYQWTRDGTNLPDGGVFSGTTTAKLNLASVCAGEQGNYSVTVVNPVGCINSAGASLTVLPDVTDPRLAITNPAPNARCLTPIASFSGTATDDACVTQVVYQLNNRDWLPASGTSAWLAMAGLTPGTNRFRAFAVDATGNCSTTNAITLVYVSGSPLGLSINGNGTVGPLTNGQMLELGKAYKVVARPAAGNLFSNWTGGLECSTPTLTFTMSSNLNLVANFVPDQFPRLKGTYTGLFYDTNILSHESSGAFTMRLTDKGAYSGKLQQGTAKYSFSGHLDASLLAIKTIPSRTGGALQLTVQLAAGSDLFAGAVSNSGWVSELSGYRSTFDSRSNPATRVQGAYTMLLPGAKSVAAGPMGHSVASALVSSGGKLKYKGTLSDGSPAAVIVPVASNGQWPLYVPLYAGHGSIFGWLTLQERATNEVVGPLFWTRPRGSVGRICPDGFTNQVEAIGSRYVTPAAGRRVLECTNGVIDLEAGDLPAPMTATFSLDERNKLISLNTNKLSLSLSLNSGTFRGSFVHPQTRKSVKLSGVLLQKQNCGGGFFLGQNQSGLVFLGGNRNDKMMDDRGGIIPKTVTN